MSVSREPLLVSEPDADGSLSLNAEQNRPKRFCWNRLSRMQCRVVWALSLAVGALVVLLITIFVGGRKLAQAQLNDSSMDIKMTISHPTSTSFQVHVVGSIDNRGMSTAALSSTVVDLSYQGVVFGKMDFPSMTIVGAASNPLDVHSTVTVVNKPAFDKYGADLLSEERIEVRMKAKITAKAMGLSFSGLDFDKTVFLLGCNSLSNPMPNIIRQSVDEGLENAVRMSLTAEIINTASVAFENVGRLNLTMMYKGVVLGYAVADSDVAMNFGLNVINQTAWIYRTPENQDLITEILSSYTRGDTLMLTLHGNPATTNVVLLQNSMATMTAQVPFKGLVHQEDKLFAAVYQYINQSHFLYPDVENCDWTEAKESVTVDVFAHNPLNVVQRLDMANLTVDWMGDPRAAYPIPRMELAQARGVNMNLVIPPLATVAFTQVLCISNRESMRRFSQYLHDIGADYSGKRAFPVLTAVRGVLIGSAGAFSNARMDYYQDNILTVSQFFNPYASRN